MTPYHAKFYAHELSRTGGEGVDRLGRALFDATVELNPHQIEAAMFALRSPLSKGVLLADEVGLGKTIEAGLVLCQSWAENRRKLLPIITAALDEYSRSFDGNATAFEFVVEAKRIDFAFLFDPMMAVHTLSVDALIDQISNQSVSRSRC